MKQQTFSDFEYSNRKRKTKREVFLEIMDEIIPWDEWVGIIMPFYPSGKRGRPPKGIELMLRMYLLQIWFNLSDEGTEDAIYDSYAMRKFVGINFLEQDVPDATTLLKFRRLLEQNGLNKLFFDAINRVMVETGHMLRVEPWSTRPSSIQLLDLLGDIPLAHPTGIQRQDLFLHAGRVPVVLADDLRFIRPIAVSGNPDLNLAELRFDSLLRVAVAVVPWLGTLIFRLGALAALTAKLLVHLDFHDCLDDVAEHLLHRLHDLCRAGEVLALDVFFQ